MQKSFLLVLLWIIGSSFSSYITINEASKTTKNVTRNQEDASLILESIKKDHTDHSVSLPGEEVFELAYNGYSVLLEKHLIPDNNLLTIIDFSIPSTEKRLWIIDLNAGKILYHSLVSHGRNSGDLMAVKFSNKVSSYMSSLGFYLTGETYMGKHGYSLRLDGIDNGFNDNARERAIVIHGAEYASEDFIKNTGRLGRSLGCPALPMGLHEEIIDTIKDKTCLFIYGKNNQYLTNSSLLKAANSTI